MSIPLTDLKVGQPVKYLIGVRKGMRATVTDISKEPLSRKDTHVITLAFDDDSLPPHLNHSTIDRLWWSA